MILHAGARLGVDGFGYAWSARGPPEGATGRALYRRRRRRDRSELHDRPRQHRRHPGRERAPNSTTSCTWPTTCARGPTARPRRSWAWPDRPVSARGCSSEVRPALIGHLDIGRRREDRGRCRRLSRRARPARPCRACRRVPTASSCVPCDARTASEARGEGRGARGAVGRARSGRVAGSRSRDARITLAG